MDIDFLKQKLLGNIIKTERGCWIWKKYKNKEGYGAMRINGNILKTHKASYQVFNGEIGEGLIVCHKCDVPPCINPDHLFLGTNRDNKYDSINKKRHNAGSNHGKTKLTEEDIIKMRRYSKLGFKNVTLARRFKLSPWTISEIITHKLWVHI